MIYATSVMDAQELERRSAVALQAQVDFLGRTRARVERETLAHTPGRLSPSDGPVEPSYGDVVIVMVDPGQGRAAADAIARHLQES